MRTAVDLKSMLRVIGVAIPDQSRIPQMMAATRIGLHPHASRPRIALAWYRKYKYRKTTYKIYEYDVFTRFNGETRLAYAWGGMPPEQVERSVASITKLIPDAKCFVHATQDDPWLEVRYAQESVFIHCWMRSGPHETVALLV